MLINFFWKTALFDFIQPTASLLLFADNDFQLKQAPTNANSVKRCWFQLEKKMKRQN